MPGAVASSGQRSASCATAPQPPPGPPTVRSHAALPAARCQPSAVFLRCLWLWVCGAGGLAPRGAVGGGGGGAGPRQSSPRHSLGCLYPSGCIKHHTDAQLEDWQHCSCAGRSTLRGHARSRHPASPPCTVLVHACCSHPSLASAEAPAAPGSSSAITTTCTRSLWGRRSGAGTAEADRRPPTQGRRCCRYWWPGILTFSLIFTLGGPPGAAGGCPGGAAAGAGARGCQAWATAGGGAGAANQSAGGAAPGGTTAAAGGAGM